MMAAVVPLVSTDDVDKARLLRILNRIENPIARKIVILSKRERGELSDDETGRLIRAAGLEAA